MTQGKHRIAFLAKPSEQPKPRKRIRKLRRGFLYNTQMATGIGLMIYPIVKDVIGSNEELEDAKHQDD